MTMYNPPHPGEIIRDILINGANFSIIDAANLLGVTKFSISKLINCHTGISPEMAVRLSIALNTSSDMWINLQKNYELWQAEKNRKKLSRKVSQLKKILLKKSNSRKKVA